MRIFDLNNWFNRNTILSQAEINTRVDKIKRLETFEGWIVATFSVVYISVMIFGMISQTTATIGVSILIAVISWVVIMVLYNGLIILLNSIELIKHIWMLSTDSDIYAAIKWQTTTLMAASVEQNTGYCYRMQMLVEEYPEIKSYAQLVIDSERELAMGDYIMCSQWARDIDNALKDEKNKQEQLERCKDLYAALASDK